MTRRAPRVLYVLLFVWIAISLSYYVLGVAAIADQRLRSERHVDMPFQLKDERILRDVTKEGQAAGLVSGDVLERFNGAQFTGDFQMTGYWRRAKPGDRLQVTVRAASSALKSVTLQLPQLQKPPWDFGTTTYLVLIVTVSLTCLLAGYWVVAARPADPNAWLVLLLLTFPEVAFGNIQPGWWGGTYY